jgi:hypothetical protein
VVWQLAAAKQPIQIDIGPARALTLMSFDALIFVSRVERHSPVICPSGRSLMGLSSLFFRIFRKIFVPI